MPKVLVNVHGAGKTPSKFYIESLRALTQILGAEPGLVPCWYGDLSNIGPVVRSRASLPPEAEEVRAEMIEEMRRRRKELEREERAKTKSPPAAAIPTTDTTRGMMDLPIAVLDTVTDVIRYLFDSKLQHAIKQRLVETLDKANNQYTDIILVSHSLGTVVAFDVLREVADRYPIRRFVTMGSPLRKLATSGYHAVDLGVITPQTVPVWRNLYDNTDLVADAIGPAFPGYLIEDVFVQIGDLPVQSHDYWRNPQVLEMIADWLR